MLKTTLYNQKGEKTGTVDLPAEIFGLKINQDLIHQSAVVQMANKRRLTAHTKDRGEVRGGGRKPWRQKGTGRARHGSIRSPIWRGGGVTFGPTNRRVFAKKISKKMKRQALLMVLSSKVQDNEIILLDKLELTEVKTKNMAEIIKNLSVAGKGDLNKGLLIILPTTDLKVIRAARNIPKTKIIRADSLNVLELLNYCHLLLLQPAIEVIKKNYCA